MYFPVILYFVIVSLAWLFDKLSSGFFAVWHFGHAGIGQVALPCKRWVIVADDMGNDDMGGGGEGGKLFAYDNLRSVLAAKRCLVMSIVR